MLERPLPEDLRPTHSENALEISAVWKGQILATVQVREKRPIWVGARGSDLEVELELAAPRVKIAEQRGLDALVFVPRGAPRLLARLDCEITEEVEVIASDGAYETVRLELGERLAFEQGPVTFLVQHVRGRAELEPVFRDFGFVRMFGFSLALHAAIVLSAFFSDVGPQLTDDAVRHRPRIFFETPAKAPKKIATKAVEFGRAIVAKARGPSVSSKPAGKRSIRNVGLLGALSSRRSSLFSGGRLGSGVSSALEGLTSGESADGGGGGTHGFGGEGGEGGGGPVDIGGLSSSHGGEPGGIQLATRIPKRIEPIQGRKILAEGIDRNQVRLVMQNHQPRFRHCYDKALGPNPNLAGKITVRFTIAGSGFVSDASIVDRTMDDESLDRCLLGVIRTLRFVAPKNGGTAVVTYPFVFSST
jgi:TonB family protein